MKSVFRISGIASLMVLLFIGGQAQVTFTNQGSALGSISGFTFTDCAVDMDGDYLDDVVRVTSNGIYIDYQDSAGGMTQQYYPMNPVNMPSWSITAGDIDGNGYNDLIFGGGSALSFVYANSTGTAYTENAQPEYIFTQRSTFHDIDNDGHLDAFACHDVDQSHPYRNDGQGTLTLDTSLIHTADLPGNYAAIWVDYNNDGHTDLYITKCRQGSSPGDPERTNLLYHNNGDGTYSEAGAAANLDDNSQSWATVFEDFDNDGDFDAFIVNHDFQNRLLCNDGSGVFKDTIVGSGINASDLGAWENAAADFDNDGNVDIFSELQDEMYWGNGDLTFTAGQLSFDKGGIGDFNNDGFLDVIDGNTLWINNGNNNHWLKVTVQGTQSNRNGIGARVEIYGAWGVQIREIRATQSFSPMSTLNAHFGIGSASAVDSIVVNWPSGQHSVLTNPAIDQSHHIVEPGFVAVDHKFDDLRLDIYPNPARDMAEFDIAGEVLSDIRMQIFDVRGQLLSDRTYTNGKGQRIDLSDLPTGLLSIRFQFDGKTVFRKLVKMN